MLANFLLSLPLVLSLSLSLCLWWVQLFCTFWTDRRINRMRSQKLNQVENPSLDPVANSSDCARPPTQFFKCKKKIENKNNVRDPFSAKISFPLPLFLPLSLALIIFCQLCRLEIAICADLSQGCVALWGALISWRQQDEEGAEDTAKKGCLLSQSIA